MKKYISIIAIMLCAFIISVKAINTDKPKTVAAKECECCKNCKDDKCKELCQKWSSMTPEAQKTADGKKVKEECMKICEEKKCCSSSASAKATCSEMEGKDCCKKK